MVNMSYDTKIADVALQWLPTSLKLSVVSAYIIALTFLALKLSLRGRNLIVPN